ncbi:unnamed protein product [Vitrella brassicaformis CCMP3155]|uniref:Uncharacterized protein n=1 Tax=Vitrella brassicaformis (strain CCMP3155) TaxID=1169540 RepID=A0A0G4G537_VITBC|nr:unnamed protein product [Vitrella brassicaformis CCMP3155]|eukprot:CEM23321.1 unnamed protein product [Vitrella brassicaformis CCMP3155]
MRPDATILSSALAPGETPRSTEGDSVGAGLLTRYLEADVVVAPGRQAFQQHLQLREVELRPCSFRDGEFLAATCRLSRNYILLALIVKDIGANPQRSVSIHDLTLYDIFRQQENCTLLLNTWVVAATKVQSAEGDDWTVTEVIGENQETQTQTQYVVQGKIFIDATGDRRLGADAYIPYIIGREGKATFNESLADLRNDNETMGSSLAFTSKNYGRPMKFTPPSWATKYDDSD